MGNSQKRLTEQITQINSLVSKPKFQELTGLNLNFSLILLNPVKILGKVVNKNDLKIQVSFVEKLSGSFSEIGTLSLENFQKSLNIIQNLLSFTATSDLDEDGLCSICLESGADTILECGHQFCLKDLQSWESRNQECPLCRSKFSIAESFVRVEGFSGEVKEEVRECKIEFFKLIEFN